MPGFVQVLQLPHEISLVKIWPSYTVAHSDHPGFPRLGLAHQSARGLDQAGVLVATGERVFHQIDQRRLGRAALPGITFDDGH